MSALSAGFLVHQSLQAFNTYSKCSAGISWRWWHPSSLYLGHQIRSWTHLAQLSPHSVAAHTHLHVWAQTKSITYAHIRTHSHTHTHTHQLLWITKEQVQYFLTSGQCLMASPWMWPNTKAQAWLLLHTITQGALLHVCTGDKLVERGNCEKWQVRVCKEGVISIHHAHWNPNTLQVSNKKHIV